MTPILGIISSSYLKSIAVSYNGMALNGGNYNILTKLDMNSETISTTTISSLTDSTGAVCSNSGVSGYRFGETTNGINNQKFSYSTESVTNLSSNLPQFRFYASGQSNSGTAAYITGGATTGFAVRYKTVVKSPFSNDTPSTLGVSFSNMGNANATASNNHIAGYTFAGESDTTGWGNWINKINYSNDSLSSSVATITNNTRSAAAFSNDGNSAYCTDGIAGGIQIYKLSYSNDSRTTISATIIENLIYPGVAYKFQNSGYFIAGQAYPTPGTYVSYIQKLSFSNESRTTLGSSLSSARGTFENGERCNNGVI